MRKRRKLSEEAWGNLIEQQEAGEQTVTDFCRSQGVAEHSFYRHKRLLREAVHGTGFRQVKLAVPAPMIRVVVMAEGSHVEVEPGFDAGLLRDVVAALR